MFEKKQVKRGEGVRSLLNPWVKERTFRGQRRISFDYLAFERFGSRSLQSEAKKYGRSARDP
jgi:hypothetical protein